MSQPQVTPCFKAPRETKKKAWWSTVPTRSDRRIDESELRVRLCERVHTRDGYRCRAAVAVPTVACGGELDVHEIIPRSAWRKGYLVMSNALSVCRAHHDWIGLHPTEAHAAGLHGFSWERPS